MTIDKKMSYEMQGGKKPARNYLGSSGATQTNGLIMGGALGALAGTPSTEEFTTGTDWTRHVLTFPPDIGNSPNSDFGEGLRWRRTISAGSDFTSGNLFNERVN